MFRRSAALTTQNLNDFKSALQIRSSNNYARALSNEALIEYARSLDPSKAKIHGFQDTDLKDEEKLGASAIAERLGIGRASVYRVMKGGCN